MASKSLPSKSLPSKSLPSKSLPLPLLALAAAAFGIGTTEFVIMGLLPEVATSFSVSIPRAGYLVSGYAMGVVVGAPIVAMATARLPRKAALLELMALFTLGNLACALAPSYGLLMLARIVTAFAHGAFFGIGAIVARDLVPREKRAQAVALMFAGLTLANVLGVPFGTALGQAAGWRSTFFAVVVIGLMAFAAIQILLPAGMPGSKGSLAKEFRTLSRWPVLRPMLVSVLSSAAFFTVFTYVAPFLTTVSGMSAHGVTYALFAAGIGLTAGNLLGGRFADRSLIGTVLGAFLSIVAALGLLYAVAAAETAAVPVLMLWAGVSFALGAPLQSWVIEAATDAPNLASTLNQGAFNLGNATGAWLGGTALTLGMGYAELPLLAAVPAALGLSLAFTAVEYPRRLVPALYGRS